VVDHQFRAGQRATVAVQDAAGGDQRDARLIGTHRQPARVVDQGRTGNIGRAVHVIGDRVAVAAALEDLAEQRHGTQGQRHAGGVVQLLQQRGDRVQVVEGQAMFVAHAGEGVLERLDQAHRAGIDPAGGDTRPRGKSR
jgi:hypothetical protein